MNTRQFSECNIKALDKMRCKFCNIPMKPFYYEVYNKWFGVCPQCDFIIQISLSKIWSGAE